jgi:hypothetical protein
VASVPLNPGSGPIKISTDQIGTGAAAVELASYEAYMEDEEEALLALLL